MVATQLQTMPVKMNVFLLGALFETVSNMGVSLGIAEQVSETSSFGGVLIEGFSVGGEKVSHMDATEG